MVYYRSGEVLNFAIRMEIAGERFYHELEKKAKEQEKRSMFAYLADEEQKHRILFEQLKNEKGVFRTEFGYDLEDYHMGLSLLEESAVFHTDEEAIQMAQKASPGSGNSLRERFYPLLSGDAPHCGDRISQHSRPHY
jgi:rubrerythrin